MSEELPVGRIAGPFGVHGELKCDPTRAGRALFSPGQTFRAQLASGQSEDIQVTSVREHKGRLLLRLAQARLVDYVVYDRLKSARPLVIAARLGYRVASEEWHQDTNRWRLERFPRRFVRLLLYALRSDRMSVASAASLTGLTIDEIADLVRPTREDFDPAVTEELEQLRDVRDRVIA